MSTSLLAPEDQQLHQKILKHLKGVDRPGDFCTSGNWPLILPGLKVTGVGTIGLPLIEDQARKLIKKCRQAPYGKGTETVVDTDVRRVWELDPDRFQLTNHQWGACVSEIVKQVQRDLGLGKRKLEAHLYKMLVYEKDGFFLPHRDGEKLDRMVATLVIGLPSEHTGGTLVVSHGGVCQELDFHAAAAGSELSYASFYADCQHEVKPVLSGYRLCLVYNLTLTASRSKKGLSAPNYEKIIESLRSELAHWRDRSEEAQKLVVTLEHRYTQKGLRIDNLKGVDRARADVLFAAAEQSDCLAHLALVTLYEHGSAIDWGCDGYDYPRGRRGWYQRDHSNEYSWSDEDGDKPPRSLEMLDVFESDLYAEHWSDQHGRRVNFSRIELEEDEIIASEPIDQGNPSQEDFEGFTGNAGMTLNRWYRRAAIVIWPRDRHFQVLGAAGTVAAIGGLSEMVRQMKQLRGARRKQLRDECRKFAAVILGRWQRSGYWWNSAKKSDDRVSFISTLCALDDVPLVRRFLTDILPTDGSPQITRPFVTFCKKKGWDEFSEELLALVAPERAVVDETANRFPLASDGEHRTGIPIQKTLSREVKWFHLMAMVNDDDAKRIALCRKLAKRLVEILVMLEPTESEQFEEDDCHASSRFEWSYDLNRGEILKRLVTGMVAVGAEQTAGRLIRDALAVEAYDLTNDHLRAIFDLDKAKALPVGSKAVSRWIVGCRKELERRTACEPKPFADYRRAADWPCDCEDCAALAEFLDAPNRKQGRFPLNQGRRQHVHQVIDHYGLDCTHVTERRGRPYTLVCTKTSASYDRELKTYRRDCENLQRLRSIESRLG